MDLKALQRRLLEQEAEVLASMPENERPAWLKAALAQIKYPPHPGGPTGLAPPLISVQPMPVGRVHYLDKFRQAEPEPSAVDQLAAIVDEDARRRLGDRRIEP